MPETGNSGWARRRGMHATSLVLLAAQLLILGHLLLVRHVTCPEHGDIIHAVQSQSSLGGRLVVVRDSPYRRSVVETTPRALRVHDHCLICTTTHERFALFPPASRSVASIEAVFPVVPPSEAGMFAPVDLIFLSPKNSPPVA